MPIIKPLLSFEFDIDLYEDEIKMKGYCNNVNVTLPDLSRHKLCFYDPTRLAQDLGTKAILPSPD